MGERDGLKVDRKQETPKSAKAEGVAPGADKEREIPKPVKRESVAPGAAASSGSQGEKRRTERDLLSLREEKCRPEERVQPERELVPPKKLNLVLEGGGLRGIALVGAIQALADALIEKEDYRDTYISYLAGTSAGSMVAVLLAAGYTPSEITDIMNGPEISRFAEPSRLSEAPIVGKYLDMAIGVPKGIWRVLTKLGFIEGDYLLGYIRELLQAKRIRSFGDLVMPGCEREERPEHRYRVHLVASDITRGRMLSLPDDINPLFYGIEPDDLDVALAVRMSISVPFVFQPVRLRGDNGVVSHIVDGGLLSNFPIRLFDRQTGPRTLTLGVRLFTDRYATIKFPFLAARTLYALGSTAIGAHDVSETAKAVDRLQWARVIEINAEAVPVFKFGPNPLAATAIEKEMLYNAGYRITRRAIQAHFLEEGEWLHNIAAEAEERLPAPAVQEQSDGRSGGRVPR
jgi:NTE family protein